MTKRKATKRSLIISALSMLTCIVMLIGSTFAWFTDSVSSMNNIITAGNLDVELLANGQPVDSTTKLFDDVELWEPGVAVYENLQVVNKGTLALKYEMQMIFGGENDLNGHKLSEVLKIAVIDKVEADANRESVLAAAKASDTCGTLKDFFVSGTLLAKTSDIEKGVVIFWEPQGAADNLYNANNGQTTSNGEPLSIEFGVSLRATQAPVESDSFGSDYDADALFPGKFDGSVTVTVPSENGVVTADTLIQGNGYKALVPAGVKLADGVTDLTLSVTDKDSSDANIKLDPTEQVRPLDVHVEGVAADNEKPIIVTVESALTKGLNIGNYILYHVEGKNTNAMTSTAYPAVHNDFNYDPATGDVVMALKSFSEVAIVAEPAKWEGIRDYSWYNASKTELTIANADQLAGLSAIVGGMDSKTPDSFKGKTVKVVADIVIGDLTDEDGRDVVFYPVGYYNSEGTYEKSNTAITSSFRKFEGTFDGNGHTISDFYQNTWEMKGDHNWYAAEEQRYRDGMGIFGKVYGGTVKNLTVRNFSSDGEITTTGVIAAYADCGATFENIAILNCNPRVYNIGNGGIVGCVGWYANEDHTKPVTFRNITVDNTNKISALWGSWDVPCGGIVGQYYPTSGQENAIKNAGVHFENCHVAAQIDVYNDVCANYQYYAYRYAGILLGSVRENVTKDGHEYPDMTGITASECTVHFGDWNDYYYCELVANSLASYTHDHQMSRLEQVAKVEGNTVVHLNGTTETVTGTRNFVVVKAKGADGKWIHGDGADYATCYHFVDGKVWNHEDAGKEVVDGVEVLKEDKQVVYREFNNLVTGYGWGVTSKGVDDMDGVKILDREVGDSVVKFNGKGASEVESETAIKLIDLFNFVNNGVELNLDGLNVTVTDLNDTDGVATGTFNKASTWEDSTITINGKGAIAITIQDYYFCEPTTIRLTAFDPMKSLTIDATKLYTVDQELNIKSVTVGYKSGKSEVVTNYTVSDVDMSFGGKKFVTVTYTEYGKTISERITVTVSDSFNALIVSSNKKVYSVGETPEFTVTAIATDGTKAEVTGFITSGADTSRVGEKKATISYANKTVTCDFKVVNFTKLTGNSAHLQWQFNPWAFYVGSAQQAFYYEHYLNASFPGGANGEKATGFNNTFAGGANYTGSPTGIVAYMGDKQYGLNVTDALPYTTLGIGCITGYDARAVGVGYYIGDDFSTFDYSAPTFFKDQVESGNSAYQNLLTAWGENGFSADTKFTLNGLEAGKTYDVHWVVVFEDGIQKIADWTVKMKSSFGDDYFKDTEKPNINVVVLSGQSNAAGATPITQAEIDKWGNVNFQNVYMKYKNVYTNDGVNVYTQNENTNFEKYYFGMGGYYDTTFGPDASLAYHLATDPNCKDEQWFIIKYTAPGTNLDLHWEKNANLTQKMMDYVQTCVNELSKDYDVQIRSLLWMQGENDALAESCANNYASNEQNLVMKFRTKFAKYASRPNGSVPGSGIAFIDAGIAPAGKNGNGWIYSSTVNAAKVNNAAVWYVPGVITEASPLFGLVDASGMNLNPSGGAIYNSAFIDTSLMSAQVADAAHYDQQSMDWLGTWFGQYVDAMRKKFN